MNSRTVFSLAPFRGALRWECGCFHLLSRCIILLLALSASPVRAQLEGVVFQDEFLCKLGEGWSWEREDQSAWRVGPGGLEIRVQPGNMWGAANNAKNVMVHPIPADMPVEISVAYSNAPTAQWEQANLVWFYDDSNMVKLGQELVTGRLSIVMGREENDRARTVAIVPLDDNAVELRLQAVNQQVRGQFRTRHWTQWRDIGECDLPVKGDPKASLQFYNGPLKEEHWIKVNNFAIRRLKPNDIDWPRVRAVERICRFSNNSATGDEFSMLAVGNNQWALANDARSLAGSAKADCEQKIFQHQDGSCGWSWNRRASGVANPTLAGIGWGCFDPRRQNNTWASDNGMGSVVSATPLALELNAVTRLENDAGNHNLSVHLWLADKSVNGPLTHKISILFDWYGKEATQVTLTDGFRNYEFVDVVRIGNEPAAYQYRIQGFRGAPPKVNLQAFAADALKHGLPKNLSIMGIWFGNEVWDGSRGGTLVTQCNLSVDGRQRASLPVSGK